MRGKRWSVAPWSDLKRGEWREDHYETLEVWGVALTNEYGDRWLYVGPLEIESKADAEAVCDRIRRVPNWTPHPDRWYPHYPVYGSTAYQEYGQREELELEEREAQESLWLM